MSGGSFDYLFIVESEALPGRLDDLKEMASALTLGGAHDAAEETEKLVRMIEHFQRQAAVRLRALSDIWKAMEWLRSGDTSSEQFQKALAKYRGEPEDQGLIQVSCDCDPAASCPQGRATAVRPDQRRSPCRIWIRKQE